MQTEFINKDIYPTTANYPGALFLDSIASAFNKPKSNGLNKDVIQICPQQSGILTESIADKIKEKYKKTKFHLHANVNILNKRYIFDASSNWKDEQTISYINN